MRVVADGVVFETMWRDYLWARGMGEDKRRANVRGCPLLGQGAQAASAPRGHSLELVINELGDVVLVVIFDDAPEVVADEVVVFEVCEQLQPRRVYHQIMDDRKRTGVAGHDIHDEFLRFVLHAVRSL